MKNPSIKAQVLQVTEYRLLALLKSFLILNKFYLKIMDNLKLWIHSGLLDNYKPRWLFYPLYEYKFHRI